jgi:hypothetical protein
MERSKQKVCCCCIQGRRFLFERTAPKQLFPPPMCVCVFLSFLTTTHTANSRISDRSFGCWWGSGDTDGRASGWAIEWPSTRNATRSPSYKTPSANKQTKFHGINTANLGYFVLSYSGGTIRVNRKRTVIQQRQLAKWPERR